MDKILQNILEAVESGIASAKAKQIDDDRVIAALKAAKRSLSVACIQYLTTEERERHNAVIAEIEYILANKEGQHRE